MNFSELVFSEIVNAIHSSPEELTEEEKELTEEEKDYINEFRDLFMDGTINRTPCGIPQFDKLLRLLNIDSDDPIAKAVAAAWKEHNEYKKLRAFACKEHNEYKKLRERLRNVMPLVEPPQPDKYGWRHKKLEDLTDEELAKVIEEYEKKLVVARDVRSLRELSVILNDIHSRDK